MNINTTMKKIIIFCSLSLLLTNIGFAQSTKEMIQLNRSILTRALNYSDLDAARNSLFTLIELEPANIALKDTLAMVYFKSGAYVQCVLIGEEIMKSNPKNMTVLELKAISALNLGLNKESLKDYETIYAETKEIYYLYQIATIQYRMKRYGECEENLSIIANDPKSNQEKVTITIQQSNQEVVMKAAVYNMMGVIQQDLGDATKAEAYFKQALSLEPDFVLAKNNLSNINTKKEPETAPEAVKGDKKKR